jgi:hypothetical protein
MDLKTLNPNTTGLKTLSPNTTGPKTLIRKGAHKFGTYMVVCVRKTPFPSSRLNWDMFENIDNLFIFVKKKI